MVLKKDFIVNMVKLILKKKKQQKVGHIVQFRIIEQPREKTCLWVSDTNGSDTNGTAQPQKMARGLKLRIKK